MQSARDHPTAEKEAGNAPPSAGHDKISAVTSDMIIRRIFGAGLDLQVAAELASDHPAAGRICRAVDELDQSIRDIRGTVICRTAARRRAR